MGIVPVGIVPAAAIPVGTVPVGIVPAGTVAVGLPVVAVVPIKDTKWGNEMKSFYEKLPENQNINNTTWIHNCFVYWAFPLRILASMASTLALGAPPLHPHPEEGAAMVGVYDPPP